MTKTEKSDGISNLVSILAIIFTIATIYYTFQARPVWQVFKYTMYISLPFIIITIIMGINTMIQKPNNSEGRLILFAGPFYFLVFSLTIYAFYTSIGDTYEWVLSPDFSPEKSSTIIILLTFSVGLVLFYFRYKLRSFYGLTEIAFGIIIAKSKVIEAGFDINNPQFFLTFITASIYLVVRGLDNVHQGIVKEPFDPVAKKIYKFLMR